MSEILRAANRNKHLLSFSHGTGRPGWLLRGITSLPRGHEVARSAARASWVPRLPRSTPPTRQPTHTDRTGPWHRKISWLGLGPHPSTFQLDPKRSFLCRERSSSRGLPRERLTNASFPVGNDLDPLEGRPGLQERVYLGKLRVEEHVDLQSSWGFWPIHLHFPQYPRLVGCVSRSYLHLRTAQQVYFRSLDALGHLVNDA